MKKRPLDLLVLSDLHLGTYGCRAVELLAYLKSVRPKKLVLNGDVIDIWQFRKNHFPVSHMKVVKRLLKLASKIPVYYVTGNHDEALRRYSSTQLGKLRLLDKLVLEIDGKRCLFFHGDIFDASVSHAKWLARLGGMSYDLLIRFNNLVNRVLVTFGRPRLSFSKRIKNSVKRAVLWIDEFEEGAAQLAITNDCDHVICGHIHQPRIRDVQVGDRTIRYMNSGDWVEHMSALEYVEGAWTVHFHSSAMPGAEASPRDDHSAIAVDGQAADSRRMPLNA